MLPLSLSSCTTLSTAPDSCSELSEHQPHTFTTEHRLCFVARKVEDAGHLYDDGRGDLVDVLARVAVTGRRFAVRACQQRCREPVDLPAVVVEVVLARHCGALRREDPGKRVSDRGPPGTGQGERSGRVGRDELEVDALPGERVSTPICLTGVDD